MVKEKSTFSQPAQESFGNETVCEGDFPVKDCDSNLIIFSGGNETKVYQNDNCVFVVLIYEWRILKKYLNQKGEQ